MSPKEILKGIRDFFNAPVAPAAAAAPAPTPAPAKTYKLSDGTEVSIAQAGETPAVGDAVTVNGAPAPAGVHTLEDGATITVDEAGKISAYTPAAPVTNDLNQNQAPAAQPAPAVIAPTAQFAASTPEELQTLVASFANGTPEERIAKLEVVCKALMEQCMGYELREAERKMATEQAIEIYKTDLKTAQASLEKHEKTITGLFDLCEKLAEIPTADPATVTEGRKQKFDGFAEKKEKSLERFAQTFKDKKHLINS